MALAVGSTHRYVIVDHPSWLVRGVPLHIAAARTLPAPAADEPADGVTAGTVVLAGGCFWGVQGVFQHVEGVVSAVSGYAGGEQATAEYAKVSRGWTGHAEAVRKIGRAHV